MLPNENEKSEHHQWILHIQIILSTKFYVNSFEFFDQMFSKRVFLFQNRKSSQRNWILHIRLRLGSKFHLKLTILIFWTKFNQNWYSKKLHFCMCPWSLLTILDLFGIKPTDTTTLIFDINLPNYLFIWIVEHWSVPSIFKTSEKIALLSACKNPCF